MYQEPTCQDKAGWAQDILQQYADKMGEEFFIKAPDGRQVVDDTPLTDLLADIMHFCRQHGVDFEENLEMARMHFEAELEDEANLATDGPGR